MNDQLCTLLPIPKQHLWKQIWLFGSTIQHLQKTSNFFPSIESKTSTRGNPPSPFSFFFFPKKDPWRVSGVPHAIECNTKATSNKEKIKCRKILALGQWRSMWSIDSSSSFHTMYLFNSIHPFLLSQLIFKFFPIQFPK